MAVAKMVCATTGRGGQWAGARSLARGPRGGETRERGLGPEFVKGALWHGSYERVFSLSPTGGFR